MYILYYYYKLKILKNLFKIAWDRPSLDAPKIAIGISP